jgi:phosphate-selective porin
MDKKSFHFALGLLIILSVQSAFCQERQDFKEEQDSILAEFQKVVPWDHFSNDKISFIPMAVVVLETTSYTQDEASERQVGHQASRYEPGQIRAMRIGVFGTLNFKQPWRYLFAGVYRAFDQGFNSDSSTNFSLYDLRLDIPTKIGTFAFGKMKEPISMQRTANMIYLGGLERGMNIDGLMPARNTGIVYYNSFAREKVYLGFGAFKGVSQANNIYWDDANTAFVGRITINPLHGLSDNHDIHIGAGGRYAILNHEMNIRQSPEVYFASKYIETGMVSGGSSITSNFEFAYRYKNFLLTSEVTGTKIRESSLENPFLNGYFVQFDYLLTGETRSYNTRNAVFMPAAPKKNVQNGGLGLWELTFRYSEFNTNSGLLTGGDMNRVSGFITWYPTLRSKLQFGYGYITLDRFGEIGHTHTFQWRFAILIG